MELYFYDEENAYLESNKYINVQNAAVRTCAATVLGREMEEAEIVRKLYEFVRDEIHHSWDYKEKQVTVTAEEVLEHKTGICWAKANLLAALLRGAGIPCGICYQKLTLGDTQETGYCLHALNVVYMKSLDKWIRLDARGNNQIAKAEFSLREERLAFPVRPEMGEVDYGIVYARPSEKLMGLLGSCTDVLKLCLHHLPDNLFEYRKMGVQDIEVLVGSRIEVLKAANKLPENADMREVEKASRNYYQRALLDGSHTAYLVYDGERPIGAGGVSFYSVMPTYHNPSGRKAYIMNMYTHPAYRRKGIAVRVLDLLVKEAQERGVGQISLEATEAGKPLYEKYGFVEMESEMEFKKPRFK